MLGRNRIRKIERLFNIKFEVFSDIYKDYKHGYVAYVNPTYNITLFIYTNKICISSVDKFNCIKNTKFQEVLQLIHEYLYDSRDYNQR